MPKHLKQPCPACPFSKAIKPGALGGSAPEVYIGQLHGPFILPCHQACDFDDPEWKRKSIDTPQCAGAAMFRANVGIADALPSALHKLEPSDKVFADPAEFYMHHKGMTRQQAEEELSVMTPELLLQWQLMRSSNIKFGA
jgi:hypothetical protein